MENDIINREYIMIGFPIITRELFRSLLRPLDNYDFKPNGGFWASEYNEDAGNISEWCSYLSDADSIARKKDTKHGVIFTLKENARILKISTEEDIINLAKKYPSYHHLLNYYKDYPTESNLSFDFEELEKEYDAVYVDYNNIQTKTKNNSFYSWSVNTLLILNLDCIKEYRSVEIGKTNYGFQTIIYISSMSESKQIKDRSSYYDELYKKFEHIFLTKYKLERVKIRDYNDYYIYILKITSESIKLSCKLYSELLKEIQKILNSDDININEEIIMRNIGANYLAHFLNSNKEKIKTLNKSKHKKMKFYHIDQIKK